MCFDDLEFVEEIEICGWWVNGVDGGRNMFELVLVMLEIRFVLCVGD